MFYSGWFQGGCESYNVEDEFPARGRHVLGQLRDAHGDVRADLRTVSTRILEVNRYTEETHNAAPAKGRAGQSRSAAVCNKKSVSSQYSLPDALAERNLAPSVPEASHQSQAAVVKSV